MRTLTNVYIKATKGNIKELNLLLKKLVIEGDNLLFESESIESVYIDEPKNKQKVSLAELKRLINTIPTREEIVRLKRQISAYKMNLSLVNERCKELQSDNDILVDCMEKLDDKLEATEKELEFFSIENESLKNIILTLKQTNDYLYDKKDTLLKENSQLKQRKWWQIW